MLKKQKIYAIIIVRNNSRKEGAFMNVKTKLYASSAVMVVAMIIMAVFGSVQLMRLDSISTKIVDHNLPRLNTMNRIDVDISDYRSYALNHVIAQDAVTMQNYESKMASTKNKIDDNLNKYHDMSTMQDKVQQLNAEWKSYSSIVKQMTAASRGHDTAKAMELAAESEKPFNDLVETILELEQANTDAAQQESDEGSAMVQTAIYTFLGICLVILIFAGFVGMKISRYIINMLKRMDNLAETLAKGDFREEPRTINSNDEFGHLANTLAKMRGQVNAVLREIIKDAETVAASSQELTASADQSAQVIQNIAQSITEVAEHSDKQGNAVDTVSSAVEQISASIQEISSNANVADDHAAKAMDIANEGGRSINMAIEQMNKIRDVVDSSADVVNELGEASKEIGQIVEQVSAIAAQTNLLALNAAIEAARAGEHGRGFAVVAEEVRKLAEESLAAVDKINNMITTIQSKTMDAVTAMKSGSEEAAKGADVVRNSGEAFENIMKINGEVASQVKDIARTTEEAAKASTNVVAAVQTVDEASKNISDRTQTVSAATEEQSAATEEIASSSRGLAEIAQTLNEAASRFKV